MAFSVAPPTIQEEVGDTATPKKKRSRGEKKSEDAGAAPGAPMVPTFAGGEAKQPGAENPYLRPVVPPVSAVWDLRRMAEFRR